MQEPKQDKRKVLYDAVSKDYSIGTYDEFVNKLNDPTKRKSFYDGVGAEYNLGNYDEFESKIGVVKKKDGTKPNSASTSASPKQDLVQKNGSSGTPQFEYKPIKDERGREVFEKDASGKLVPAKEKVLKGYASSTEERGIVREELKQKALKEVKPSVKYQDYKVATQPKQEEIDLLSQDVDAEINQQGFLNGLKTGAKKGVNFLADAFTAIGTLGTETDGPEVFDEQPFSKESKEAEKQLLSEFEGEKSRVTPDAIKERTKKIVLDKKVEALKVDKNNEFLSKLPESEKKALELERVSQYKTISDRDKYLATESSLLINELESLSKDYAIVKAIAEKASKNGTELTPEFIEKSLELENNLTSKVDDYQKLEKEYSENTEEIGSAEEEVDFLKRNYSGYEKFKTNVKLGLGDLYVNVSKGLPVLISDLDDMTLEKLRFGSGEGIMSEEERKVLIDEIIDWESAKSQTKNKYKRDVEFGSINTGNIGQFIAQEIGTQIPVFAQMALPGGVVSIGVTSASDKYGQMEMESNQISFNFKGNEIQGYQKEDGSIVDGSGFSYNPDDVKITSFIKPDYSKSQMLATAVGFGTAEAVLGALPTKNALGRVVRSFENSNKRQLLRSGFKSFVTKPGKEAFQESWTEGATSVIQNFLDIKVLGKNDVGLFDNVDHAMFTGGLLGGMMGSVPAIAGLASRPFSNKTETKVVRKNLAEILALREQLNNPDISDAVRKATNDKINTLETENTKVLTNIAERSKGLTKEAYEAIVSIDKKQELLRLQASEIKADKSIKDDFKQQLLNDLKVEFNMLEDKRSTLNSKEATILDTLPDSEKSKLRNEATEIIKLENTGDGEAKIDDKQVTKKAIELYEKSNAVQQEATTTETKQETQPQAEVQETEQEAITKEDIEVRRKETESKIKRKDLFSDGGTFSNILGESGVDSVPTRHTETNGIEFVEFSNPNTGIVDVVMSGTSSNDFVGYYRVYENGKPTEKWSSKFENQSRNKENFKTMIGGVQSMLPKGHLYTEKTSISTDGLRVWEQQLSRGYEIQTDENGNIVTNEVTINGDAIVNELGIDVNQGNFDNISVTNRQQFESVKKALLPYLQKLGLNESNIRNVNGTVEIDLPVLRQKTNKEQSNNNQINEPSDNNVSQEVDVNSPNPNQIKTISELEVENKTTLPKIPSEKIFKNEVSPLNRNQTKGVDKIIDDRKENDLPIEEVDVNLIFPTQKTVNTNNLKKTSGITEETKIDEPIILVKENGKYFVVDGHHRISNEILNGKSTVKAKVFDNESTQTENIAPDGNVGIGVKPLAEVGGKTKPKTKVDKSQNVSPTVDSKPIEGENEVEYALNEINKGILEWSGDILSPRIDLGISWADIRKGEADIKRGKPNTVPAKRLVEAINNAKKEGGYRYKQGTGGPNMRSTQFVSFDDMQKATNQDGLTDAEINEIAEKEDVLAKQYDEYFNSLDEESQNEILENYENKPREISENTEIGKSENDVSNEQKEEGAREEKVKEDSVLDRILNQDELKDTFDFLDSLKIDPNDLKATLPFLPNVWNAFIDAVKLSMKAGNTMRKAILEAKNVLESNGFDKLEINKVLVAFQNKYDAPNKTFQSEKGKKSLLSRMAEGKDSEVKKAISDYSLDYEVENQEIAQRNADLFVEKVGIRSALKAVRKGSIVGAEKAFVYAKIIDVISNEITNVPESEIQELEDINLQVLEEIGIEFDKESRNAGRFISALQKVYSSSSGRYNLTKQVQSYKARHDGNIPDEVLKKFLEADKKIKEYEKRIEQLEAEKKIQEEEKAFNDIVEAVIRKSKLEKNKGITNKAKAKAFADKLRTFKTTNKGTLNASTPMSLAYDLAIETAAKTIEKTGIIADAVKNGIDIIRKSKLNDLEKQEAVSQFLNAFDVNEGSTSNLKIDDDGKLKIPHSLIREKVEQGIDNIDDLVDSIYEDVLEMYPDNELNKREVRDLITQYGKTINPTKDVIELEISRLKSLGKLLSGIEDALSGKRPLRSGLQKRELTLEERNQKRKLRELLRDLPMDDGDLSKAWKTALDTIKTRLNNEIQDLDDQISKGEKRKGEKTQIEYDAEANSLKELRDEKRKILDELVGKPELTEEQKIEKSMILVQKSIDALQSKIINGEIEYNTKPTPVSNAKLDALKKQRKELYKQIDQMRKDSGLAEKKRLDLAKRSRIRRIEELKDKIERRDFSKKEVKELPVDAELLELESKLQEQKGIYEKEKYIDELNNRSRFRKFASTFVDLIGVTRVLKAGGEFSQVLVQQGFLTPEMLIRNPKEFFRAFAMLGKAFVSPDKAKEYEDKMKAHPLYPLMQKTRLSLTGTDHRLDAQEENYQLDMVTDIWNIIGDKIDKISGGKDVLTLTGLFKKLLNKELTESDRKSLGTQFKEGSFWKMFERAAVTYSNHIKIVKFEQGVTELQKDLKDPINDIEDYKRVSNYINVFSGRAGLGKAEFISKDAALFIFSLRNAVSQFQQLNPFYYLVTLGDAKQFRDIKTLGDIKKIRPTSAQKMAVKSFMTSTTAIIGFKLAFMAIANSGKGDDEEKWTFETDPRSSDYGKMRKGKTTFDMWHGLNGLFVLYSRILLQETKSIKTGEIKELGKGFGTATTSELLIRYVTNKFAPSAGYAWRLGYTHKEIDPDTGESFRVDPYGNVFGEKEMVDLFIPIYYGAVYEISQEDPDTYQKFLTSLGLLGMSVGADTEGDKFKKKKKKKSQIRF